MPDLFQHVYPIGDTDPAHLPVRDLDAALSFYLHRLGFRLAERREHPTRSARLVRDAITLTLDENGGDPEQASVYIAVRDVDAAHAAFHALDVSPIRLDEHAGSTYRVFFLRAPDGLCYCFGQPAEG